VLGADRPARERQGPWAAASDRVIGLGPQVPRRGNGFSQWLGLALLRLLGWRIRGYWPNVPKAVVIVAPHTSNRDGILSVIAMMALRLRLQFFMKHSAFPWPFAGLIQWFGGIPVNRAAAHDLVTASAEQFAAREQLLIAITPDGTRHAPKEWKKGFYWIAHRAQVPILCVGYDYARREIVIMDAMLPSGNVEAELPWLQQRFRGIAPKHADRLSAPLRDVNKPR
jgi:1-acyl-sn-glycerol-3-phosphate acyltransferase